MKKISLTKKLYPFWLNYICLAKTSIYSRSCCKQQQTEIKSLSLQQTHLGLYRAAGTALGFVRDTEVRSVSPSSPWCGSSKLAVIPERVNYVWPVLESPVRQSWKAAPFCSKWYSVDGWRWQCLPVIDPVAGAGCRMIARALHRQLGIKWLTLVSRPRGQEQRTPVFVVRWTWLHTPSLVLGFGASLTEPRYLHLQYGE